MKSLNEFMSQIDDQLDESLLIGGSVIGLISKIKSLSNKISSENNVKSQNILISRQNILISSLIGISIGVSLKDRKMIGKLKKGK